METSKFYKTQSMCFQKQGREQQGLVSCLAVQKGNFNIYKALDLSVSTLLRKCWHLQDKGC